MLWHKHYTGGMMGGTGSEGMNTIITNYYSGGRKRRFGLGTWTGWHMDMALLMFIPHWAQGRRKRSQQPLALGGDMVAYRVGSMYVNNSTIVHVVYC